ncbi:unnamed protein product [Scytosiphon promiscuus]
MSSPSTSPKPAPISGGMSVKDRARTWQANASTSPSPSPPRPTPAEKVVTPPPTIEEIEAMETAEAEAEAEAARAEEEEEEEEDTPAAEETNETCRTAPTLPPSDSNVSANKQPGKPYSRQVSRVSGLGRTTARAATPRAAAAAADAPPAASPVAAATAAAVEAPSAPQSRGRSPRNAEQGPSSAPRKIRRSISVDDAEHRPRQTRSARGQRPMANGNRGVPPPRAINGGRTGIARPTNNPVGRPQQQQQQQQRRRVQQQQHKTRPQPTAGRGRTPYTAQGTPSAATASNRQQQQHRQGHHQAASSGALGGGSRNFDITSSSQEGARETAAPKIRRHNSAPDMGVMGDEADDVAPPSRRQAVDEPPAQACWGGGLPPTCGPAAARAAMAAAAATEARAAGGSTAGSSRYPANDRESFARTLNEDELDEVWKGLGEGVSQRGCGSEVAYEVVDNAPASPSGTGVSGLFPTLTANVLERHDQLADGSGSGGGSSGGRQGANVMPMPKKLGERTPEDMENGTRRSSKRSKGSGSRSDPQQETTLLGAIVSYGILVLWVAHLVFNILLLWRVVVDDYIWGLCFLPGVLGILLSFNSCRKSHRHCKPVVDEAEGPQPRRSRRTAPHACALPAHTVLFISAVVCLGMHASAMLFCERDMLLLFEEETLEPLCDESSLMVPVILDGVLLSVAGLKASSVCWAWVLS